MAETTYFLASQLVASLMRFAHTVRVVASVGMQVAAADAGGHDLDLHLAGAGLRHGNIIDANVLATVEYRGFHHWSNSLLISSRLISESLSIFDFKPRPNASPPSLQQTGNRDETFVVGVYTKEKCLKRYSAEE